MSSAPAALPNRVRTLFTSHFRVPMMLSLVLIGLAGWQGWEAYRATQLPGKPVTMEVIEAQWGIRITHIAVLADGGLIDFRFQTIDPNKAAPLFNLENRPLLIVEKTGQVVDSLYHPPHSHSLLPGESHYFLYNNRGGVIQPGTLLSVVLGDLRLEHVVAQ